MTGLILTMLLGASPAAPESLDEALGTAEREYAAGLAARENAEQARTHFLAAAAAWEHVWNDGNQTPALARNLAQAWLLAGDLARAIRAYHWGQRLTAHDAELRAGLEYARAQVRYPVNGSLSTEARYRDRRSILRYQPAWIYAVIAFGVYLLAFLSLARGWMSRQPIWFASGTVLLILAVLGIGAVMWEDKHLSDERVLPLAIVAKDGAELRRGNGIEFPLRISERLPEGVEMIVLGERGGWYQVQLAGGAVGWVNAGQVIRV